MINTSCYKTGDLVGLYLVKQKVKAYSCVDFKRSTEIKVLQANEIIRVTDIVRYGKYYLLKLDSNFFVTTNKEIVEKL